MTICILCLSVLARDTKREHIWLAALGGKATTRHALCSVCNNEMGSGPDKALADSVALLRNIMSFKSGRGDDPPVVRQTTRGDVGIVLMPGGIPRADRVKPFTISPRADGKADVEVRVTSEQHLRDIMPDLARALRVDDTEVRALLEAADVRNVSQPVETLQYRLSVGGQEAMRSMCKTCLVLWADLHGAEELQKPIYDDARRFVLHGHEALQNSICQIDFGLPPDSDIISQRFGQHYNLAAVASDEVGRTMGYFRLYNAFAWRFTLCRDGGPASAIMTYVSNPERPTDWQLTDCDDLILPATVLDLLPSQDDAAVRSALARMYADYQDRASRAEIEKIFEQIAAKVGLAPDDPMSVEQYEQFVREVCDRLMRWVLRMPHEDTLSADEIRRILQPDEQSKPTSNKR